MTTVHDNGPKWSHKPNPNLQNFHLNRMVLPSGYRRSDFLNLTDEEFERHHGFIQWAFPTPEKSRHNFSAPVLDIGTAIWLADDAESVSFFEEMAVRFLKFLKANDHWKAGYNHNHLRITRVIQSLRILHSCELSQWFHEQVVNFAGDTYHLMENPSFYWNFQSSPVHDRASYAGIWVMA